MARFTGSRAPRPRGAGWPSGARPGRRPVTGASMASGEGRPGGRAAGERRWLGTPWHLGMCFYWLWVYLSFNCVQISGTAADGSPMLPVLHISSSIASCAALAAVVLLHRRVERSGALRWAAWAGAALTALGTLMYALPAADALGAPSLPVAGAVLTGLASPAVALAWGVSYSRLDARRAAELAAGSFFIAAALYWAVAVMPGPWNGLAVSAAPVLSVACLAASRARLGSGEVPGAASSPVQEPLGRELRRLVLGLGQWRSALGLFVTMFACGGLRVHLMHLEVDVFSHPVLMAAPIAAMAALFFLYGRTVSHTSLSLGSLYRVVPPIFALAIMAIVASDLASPTVSFVAATAGDALIAMLTWVLLAEASRTTHFSALLVYAAGRLVIHAGMLLGEFAGMQFRGDMTAFFLVAIVLLVCVSGMMFAGPGASFAFEPPLEGELGAAGAAGGQGSGGPGAAGRRGAGASPDAGASAASPDGGRREDGAEAQETAMLGRFEQIARQHDLSPRETEVFLLWATGHGSRAIEERLSVSPATVKTHLRHIYAKCDVHSRAELLELIERAA